MDFKNSYTPYIRVKDDVKIVMLDVILALLPGMLIALLVYGLTAFVLIATCVISAVLAEIIFSKIFFNKIHLFLQIA